MSEGNSFWSVRNLLPAVRGYCLLKFEGCYGIRVTGVRLIDSPMYQVVIADSAGIRLDGLTTSISDKNLGDEGPHNTDGVNIIGSKDIDIVNSVIESGDDNIVIKEGSHDIRAENVLLVRGKGISIGSLGEGSSEGQIVTNIKFQNVAMKQCVHGARIKTWKGASGLVKNVSFSNFRLQDVSLGVLVDQTYCPTSQRPEGCSDGVDQAISIQDVQFRAFKGVVLKSPQQVNCMRCNNVTFTDFSVKVKPDPNANTGNLRRTSSNSGSWWCVLPFFCS